MTREELRAIREQLKASSHQQMADLLHVERVVYTRYENGTRPIPAYISRSIEFFLSLSKRARERFLKQARRKSHNNGLHGDAARAVTFVANS